MNVQSKLEMWQPLSLQHLLRMMIWRQFWTLTDVNMGLIQWDNACFLTWQRFHSQWPFFSPTTATQLETESVSMQNQNHQLCYSVSLQILYILNGGQFERVTHFGHLSDFREEEQRNSVQNCQQRKHLECHPSAPEAASFSPRELPALLHSGRQLKSYPGKTSLSLDRKIQWFRIWICRLEWTVWYSLIQSKSLKGKVLRLKKKVSTFILTRKLER